MRVPGVGVGSIVLLVGFYALSAHLLAFGINDKKYLSFDGPALCTVAADEQHSWLVMWFASSLALFPLMNLEHWYWSSLDFFSALQWSGAFALHEREGRGETVSAADWRACSRLVHRRWPRAVSYMIMYTEEPWGCICKGLLLCAALLFVRVPSWLVSMPHALRECEGVGLLATIRHALVLLAVGGIALLPSGASYIEAQATFHDMAASVQRRPALGLMQKAHIGKSLSQCDAHEAMGGLCVFFVASSEILLGALTLRSLAAANPALGSALGSITGVTTKLPALVQALSLGHGVWCGLLLLRLSVSTLGFVQFLRWYALFDAAETHLRVDTRPYRAFLYELDACVATILVLQLTAVAHIFDFSTGCFASHSRSAQLAYAAFAAANAMHAVRWAASVVRTRLFLRPGDDLPDRHYDHIVATTKRLLLAIERDVDSILSRAYANAAALRREPWVRDALAAEPASGRQPFIDANRELQIGNAAGDHLLGDPASTSAGGDVLVHPSARRRATAATGPGTTAGAGAGRRPASSPARRRSNTG